MLDVGVQEAMMARGRYSAFESSGYEALCSSPMLCSHLSIPCVIIYKEIVITILQTRR